MKKWNIAEYMGWENDETQLRIKTKSDICKKAIAMYIIPKFVLSVGLSTKYDNAESQNYLKENSDIINNLLEEKDLEEYQIRVLNGTATEQEKINSSWEIESSLVLFWALGILKKFPSKMYTISYPDKKIMTFLKTYKDFDSLVNSVELRPYEELDKKWKECWKDHWGCVDIKFRGMTKDNKFAEDFDEETVMEHRKAIQWILTGEDWNHVNMDT